MENTTTTDFQLTNISGLHDKEFRYLPVFDLQFARFAENCQSDPDTLINSIEEVILHRHHLAVGRADVGLNVWYLETDKVGFFYQVQEDAITIGSIRSRATGELYESRHDLLAEFD